MEIGYISFRIAGNDGVSLEAHRWHQVLQSLGHHVTFIAGELDQKGVLLPEIHFSHPQISQIHDDIIYNKNSFHNLEKRIFTLAGSIEGTLRQTFRTFKFDRLIVANVFSLPMHFPLSAALDRTITTYQLPTISRNHDFWWERKRYTKASGKRFFQQFFPPSNPLITHTVINSITQHQLKHRTGIQSQIIADSFDFDSQLNRIDSFNHDWRQSFGIAPDDIVFLQATRIVPRKNIELSIEFVRRLQNPKAIFIVAGQPGDEGHEYYHRLKTLASRSKIRFKFIGDRIRSQRSKANGTKYYSLWDCFIHSDFITYPSKLEGFGNQFVEAVYFKKPVLINRYPVFKKDIEPLGFKAVKINGRITKKSITETNSLLSQPQICQKLVEHNFKLGKKHFSYQALKAKLTLLGF